MIIISSGSACDHGYSNVYVFLLNLSDRRTCTSGSGGYLKRPIHSLLTANGNTLYWDYGGKENLW